MIDRTCHSSYNQCERCALRDNDIPLIREQVLRGMEVGQ